MSMKKSWRNCFSLSYFFCKSRNRDMMTGIWCKLVAVDCRSSKLRVNEWFESGVLQLVKSKWRQGLQTKAGYQRSYAAYKTSYHRLFSLRRISYTAAYYIIGSRLWKKSLNPLRACGRHDVFFLKNWIQNENKTSSDDLSRANKFPSN